MDKTCLKTTHSVNRNPDNEGRQDSHTSQVCLATNILKNQKTELEVRTLKHFRKVNTDSLNKFPMSVTILGQHFYSTLLPQTAVSACIKKELQKQGMHGEEEPSPTSWDQC